MTTEPSLAEQAKELAAKAAPGPWHFDGNSVLTPDADTAAFIAASRELVPALAAALLAAEQRADELTAEWAATIVRAEEAEQENERLLARWYRCDSYTVGRLCDEKLDRSGALLGRIRKLAFAPQPAPPTEEKA